MDLPDFDSEEVFRWLVIVSSILSIIFSGAVIFAYVKFKALHSFAFKLVTIICITDILNSVAYLLVAATPGSSSVLLCQLSGIILQFSNLSCFLTTSIIAYTTLQTLLFNQKNPSKLSLVIYCLIYVLPAIAAIIPALENQYIPETSYFCWIDQKDQTYYLVFIVIIFFGTLWVSVIFFIICIIRVQIFLKKTGVNTDIAASIYKKLFNFPGIIALCWLPATIIRFIAWFQEDNAFQDNHPITFFLQVSFDILASFLIVMVFGFNDQVKAQFRQLFSRSSNNNQAVISMNVDSHNEVSSKASSQKTYQSQSLSHPLKFSDENGVSNDIAFLMNDGGQDIYQQQQQHLPHRVYIQHEDEYES